MWAAESTHARVCDDWAHADTDRPEYTKKVIAAAAEELLKTFRCLLD
jgi:hypothetical protein